MTPPLPPAQSTSSPQTLAALLAFTAGFVDTAGFICLGGLFLAHVTGNFVVLGAQTGRGFDASVIEKLAVLPLFVLGVAAAWALKRVFTRRPALCIAMTEAALLSAAALSMFALERGLGPSSLTRPALIASGVFAMAMQASLSRVAGLPMTTVMTGNVVQITSDALDALFSRTPAGRHIPGGVWLVAAFACGALCAGFGLVHLGAAAMLAPVCTTLMVSWLLAQSNVNPPR